MKVVCVALIVGAPFSGAPSHGLESQAPVIWIAMEGRARLKKIAPGTMLEGRLAHSVYWRNSEVFPKGSTVRLVVDQIESRKRAGTPDDRPFVINVFAPRHELAMRFQSVRILMPGGKEVPLRATFIALSQRAELSAETAKPAARTGDAAAGEGGHATMSKPQKPAPPWVLTLQAEAEGTTFTALAEARAGSEAGAPAPCPEPCTIAEGTRMPLVLVGGLSASRDHQGQSFQAVLLEPVLAGSSIAIPQGRFVQGVLARRVPPRLAEPGVHAFDPAEWRCCRACRFPGRRGSG